MDRRQLLIYLNHVNKLLNGLFFIKYLFEKKKISFDFIVFLSISDESEVDKSSTVHFNELSYVQIWIIF